MKKVFKHANFDFSEEQKEYSLLCRGKSEKYTFYTDWEEHIKTQLRLFQTPKELYNFKRYCKNCERSASQLPTVYWMYLALLIPMLIDLILYDLPNQVKLLWVVGVLGYTIYKSKVVVRESFFYTDVIEIIEEVEKENVIH